MLQKAPAFTYFSVFIFNISGWKEPSDWMLIIQSGNHDVKNKYEFPQWIRVREGRGKDLQINRK